LNKLILIILLLIPLNSFGFSSVIFMDRFNDDLSGWSLDETGGSVSIVTQDYSPKMKLNDTSGVDAVSAVKSFTEGGDNYLIEYDEKIITDGDVCIMELLDASNNVIASVTHGAVNDTVSFDTDNATASTATWNNNVYKQVVLYVNKSNSTITFWISGDNETYSPLVKISTAKSYSGTSIAKIKFSTSTGTSVAYIDEVRAYFPDLVIIGDSISDGKYPWSNHPAFLASGKGRLSETEDETSSPSQQLSVLIKNDNTYWVGNRGFGGAMLDGSSYSVDDEIQSVVVDQGFKKVIVAAGVNDLDASNNLTTMQTDLNSIVTQLQNAGITGREITLCTVAPAALLDSTQNAVRASYNSWIITRATEITANLADNATALKSTEDADVLNASYDEGDGTHMNKAGSGVMAQTIYVVLPTQVVGPFPTFLP
jgi:lysophospholipase L1-like esterase